MGNENCQFTEKFKAQNGTQEMGTRRKNKMNARSSHRFFTLL